MKTMQPLPGTRRRLLAGLLGILAAGHSQAQFTFESGSDGSYGPMNITSITTLTLPADGKFHCTTITVASNVTLRFTPNVLNTPVYLLATGSVTIDGTVDVGGNSGAVTLGGAGGPGGFAGGNSGAGGLSPGDGHGPGAGRAGTSDSTSDPARAGHGAYGTDASGGPAGNGATYGSPLLVPLVGGSGGGGRPSRGGTGGGGAILIASNSDIMIHGKVLARSGVRYGSPDGVGSGGAIRLVAPVVSGQGTLDVSPGYSPGGGAGRIRIDCMDRRALVPVFLPYSSVVSIGANMMSFLSNPPRLDIVQAADNDVPVGSDSPVSFLLPQDSSTNQMVVVRASHFGSVVPIRVVLTPDNGPGTSYDVEIDNSVVDPASVTVPVVVPVNVQVHVHAWTR